MSQQPPHDYNPHTHGKAPSTRVELLAWEHKASPLYLVRCAAATILVLSRCLHSHTHADQRPALHPVPCWISRAKIATQWHKLRKHLRYERKREGGFYGQPAFLSQLVDNDGERMERQNEGRMMPTPPTNFHD